jgi:eukaryotic-like serine/threonine-protein kinase
MKGFLKKMVISLRGGSALQDTTLPDATSTPAKTIGGYVLERKLGAGAMGAVFLGKDAATGREAAIKTMALGKEFDADMLEDVKSRFLREAKIAERLNHPNIVAVYGSGEEDGLAYIAMEFLKGADMLAYTRPNNLLPAPKVLNIIARVAEALGYAHEHNVVHRDIKPENIMYDPVGNTVKVMDFGISRIIDDSKTRTGMVLGTPYYMSPEQLRGKKIEGPSDLFSLGVSLYQLLAGRLPFPGDSLGDVMFRIAKEPHVNILSIRPDLPACVSDIIDRALAKEIGQRYQTGQEMAAAIQECLALMH